jgi:hypothetical protein
MQSVLILSFSIPQEDERLLEVKDELEKHIYDYMGHQQVSQLTYSILSLLTIVVYSLQTEPPRSWKRNSPEATALPSPEVEAV